MLLVAAITGWLWILFEEPTFTNNVADVDGLAGYSGHFIQAPKPTLLKKYFWIKVLSVIVDN